MVLMAWKDQTELRLSAPWWWTQQTAPPQWWWWTGLVTYLQPEGEVELLVLTKLGQLGQEDRQLTD